MTSKYFTIVDLVFSLRVGYNIITLLFGSFFKFYLLKYSLLFYFPVDSVLVYAVDNTFLNPSRYKLCGKSKIDIIIYLP